ncbi:MAG TPA: DUF2092 domain-containing protein [Gemmatimonadaceae bacterium]|jgi:hypothetical protein|nr:DUF2092 domain-containing protein [Gemmatimonadaceae bacterium]
MKHSRIGARVAVGIAALAVAGLSPSRAAAQDTTYTKPVADSAAGDVDRIDKDAIDALEKMGAYLRTLKAFSVHALVTTEDVMENGQKVQRSSVVDLTASRPDKMRVEIADQRQPRTLLYDGKTFTMWAPRVKYYATTNAPSTIIALIDTLDERFDIDVPGADLFRWGTAESDVANITDATDLGPAAINGVTCEQYAFRQAGLDWQIWIQRGDFPLPLKLVLTTTTDEARPQHSSTYTWNLAPSYNDKAFVFDPPSDAKKITFADVAAARAAEKKAGGYK